MKMAYLDCASGISGDMTLGALVDVGVPLDLLQDSIDSLGLPTCRLVASQVKKKGFRATHVQVEYEPEHAHRHLHQIVEMIESSRLTQRQRQLAIDVFTRLGEAEAKVHGTTLQKVHFHEVGAVDSIADIVGSAVGWDWLQVDQIVASPIPTGCGTVNIAHGRVSLPAPATAELLRRIPLEMTDVEAELTTPTGAALVAVLCTSFGPLPAMIIEQVGYGAGTRDLDDRPNMLRLMVGESADHTDGELDRDAVCLLQTNLDDAPGEWLGHVMDCALEQGALDVYCTPIQMKKNRPATLLSVLCRPGDAVALEKTMFLQTGTLGVRRQTWNRHVLPRRAVQLTTPWGPVDGKLVRLPGGELRFTPEFETCRKLARQHRLPLPEVYRGVQRSFDLCDPPISW